MTILNPTDAAKAAVTPAAATALYLPLQNLDGTPAGRIKLSGVLPHGDSTTLTEAADGTLSVVGQAPTAISTTPTLVGLQMLLANGQYVTGAQLAALLGTTTSSSTTPTTIAADGTLSGLPSTTVAGQPLSSASYVPTTGAASYLVLYNVGAAAEEGARFTPNVMPGGNLSLLIPQTANRYTVRGFAAATGGSATYESAQFNVTPPPGALPATPTQTADTGATSSGVTMNWTATAANYRVLTRSGVGAAYGSLSDTTITATSYTFANQAASSLVRAVVIPQNAYGSGTPSGQFISFTAAQATPTPTPTPTTPNTVTLAGATFAPSAGYNTSTMTTTGGGSSPVVLTMSPIDHYAPAGNLTPMSGAGTWTAKVAISEANSNFYEGGLLLVSADGAANTKLRLQFPGSSTGYIGMDGSNSTVANVGNINSPAGANGGPLYMRAVNNGTSWIYAISGTGLQGSWTVIDTVPITAMAVLTQIGPYVDAWDSQQAGVPAILTMSGWSVTTATDPQAALQ